MFGLGVVEMGAILLVALGITGYRSGFFAFIVPKKTHFKRGKERE